MEERNELEERIARTPKYQNQNGPKYASPQTRESWEDYSDYDTPGGWFGNSRHHVLIIS